MFSFLGEKARGRRWSLDLVLTGNKLRGLFMCSPRAFHGSPIKGDGHAAHDSLSWSQPSECGLSRPPHLTRATSHWAGRTPECGESESTHDLNIKHTLDFED